MIVAFYVERPLSLPKCGFRHTLEISHLFLCIVSVTKTSWDADKKKTFVVCQCLYGFSLEWGIYAAIFSACLMAETAQWATHTNMWFEDDFCLRAIETSGHIFSAGQLSHCHFWGGGVQSILEMNGLLKALFLNRKQLIIDIPQLDDFTAAVIAWIELSKTF